MKYLFFISPDTVQRRRCFKNSESSSGHCVNTSERAQYRILQPRWGFNKIRWKIQIKPPGWSSCTAKGPRRDHKQGIRVLWCEIEEIILSCVPLPLCHCRVHIDNRRNIFVSALVLVDGARTEKWKTSRSATNIPDYMLRCLWRQNWFNWKLFIPTLNIICPVRYSKICIKICKLFFDLLGCIWAQTPPVFGCSCITCDQTEMLFF